jgi:hypothetical protein
MKKIILAMLFIWLQKTALAVTMSNLYQVEVLVPSQTNELRDQAARDGLLQVLKKISGNLEIDKNPVIKAALKKAEYYVQDYSYSSDSTDASQYQLKISYEPQDVNRLLAKAKVASWGENRPLTLVWLAVTDKQHISSIIGNEMTGTVFDNMMRAGKNFGIPLIFPMMDVDEINKVSVEDIKARNMAQLKEIAKRYSPEALLLGEIEENDQSSDSHWQLIMKDTEWDWKISNSSTDEVIKSVINQVSQAMSGIAEAQATIPETQATIPETQVTKPVANAGTPSLLWVTMQVSHISKRDLRRLIYYLKKLDPVQQVKFLQVERGAVKLLVQVKGTLATFEQSLLNKHLVLQSEDDTNATLIYKWIK